MAVTQCPTCGVAIDSDDPCRTASGRSARTWHTGRSRAVLEEIVENRRTPLVAVLEEALEAASWLTAADEVSVSLLRDLLEAIDDEIDRTPGLFDAGKGSKASRIAYPASNAIQLLDRLGLTPEGRRTLGVTTEDGDDDDPIVRLAERFGGGG